MITLTLDPKDVRELLDVLHECDDPSLPVVLLERISNARDRLIRTESRQLWPRGTMVELRTDGHVRYNRDDPWREPTADELREIAIDDRARHLWNADCIGCQSHLVTEMIGQSEPGFEIDDIQNLYPDGEAIVDNGEAFDWFTNHDDIATLTGLINDNTSTDEDWGDTDDEDVPEEAADAVAEYINENAESADVMEWWQVTRYLHDLLNEHGEVTIDNDHGYYWGRTCTGQGVLMDGTIQEIAATLIG